MLPPKPYRPSHKKFGLLPEEANQEAKKVPSTVQTLTLYTLLAPLVEQPNSNTELANKLKDTPQEKNSQAE